MCKISSWSEFPSRNILLLVRVRWFSHWFRWVFKGRFQPVVFLPLFTVSARKHRSEKIMKPFLVILWVVLHGGALWWNAVAGMPAYGMLERDESDAVWSAPDMDALQPVAAVMGQRELTPKPSPVYTAAGIDEPSPRPFYPASWWGPIAFHGGLSPRYFADEFGPRTPTQGGVAKRGIPNRQIRAILFHDYDDEVRIRMASCQFPREETRINVREPYCVDETHEIYVACSWLTSHTVTPRDPPFIFFPVKKTNLDKNSKNSKAETEQRDNHCATCYAVRNDSSFFY